MSRKTNKRDKERIKKRKMREKLKQNILNSLHPMAKTNLVEEKSRISCNLNSKLADELILYVKKKEVPFKSRASLLEHIIMEWSRENNILEI